MEQGGIGFSNIEGDVTIGNVAGRDLTINNHYDNVRPRAVDPATLAEAEALLATMPTDSVPAVAPLPPGSHVKQLAPNPHFVGREDEMQALARLLKAGDTAAIAAATGTGGLGKTQLAIEWVHRYGQFFAGGVFWLSFEQPVSIPSEAVAGGLRGHPELPTGFATLPLPEQLPLIFALWQSPLPRLLVFDNCEEPALLQAWRPPTGGCRVLVTSRVGAWPRGAGVSTLALQTLPRPESIALLRRFRPDLAAGDPALDAIAAELGDLPLALHLAGSFLDAYRDTAQGDPARYLAALRDRGLLDHPSMQGRGAEPSPSGHDLHVARTFALSVDRLDPADPTDALARALLARAAHFLPGEPLPRALLLATLPDADELDRADALRRLIALGLVDAETDTTLRLHRLVARFVLSVSDDETAQGAVEKTIGAVARGCNNTGNLRLLHLFLSHLRHVTEATLAREDEQAAMLSTSLGYHLHTTGNIAAALPLFQRALHIREQQLGPNHPDTAHSLINLAELHRSLGNFTATLPLLQRALHVYEQLGPDYPIATALNNLGMLYYSQGNFAAALPLLQRALHIREQQMGPDHPAVATILNNLGLLLHTQGAYTSSLPLYQRALHICEQHLDPYHPDTAQSLNNLASLYYDQNNLSAALPLLQRALHICDRQPGPYYPETAQTLDKMAMLYRAQGNLPAALPLCQRALHIRVQQMGLDHQTTVQSLNNLAMLYHDQGNLAAALPLYQYTLHIHEIQFGPDHLHTATSLNNLASLYQDAGDLATALPLYQRAFHIRLQQLGPHHPAIATSLNNLAGLLSRQVDFTSALPLYQRALEITEQAMGPDHPNTLIVRSNLEHLQGLMKGADAADNS